MTPSVSDLSSFMHSVCKQDKNKHLKDFNRICYILSDEFNWSYDEIMVTPIPFIFDLLNQRLEANKEQERQSKRKR